MLTIGIDLGTTNSLVSYWNGTKPQLIKNRFDNFLTPSVVSSDKNGQIYVGEIAKQRLISHPQLTVSNFKRKMGTKTTYKLLNKKYRPEELSALVLKQLKDDAEHFLGNTITSAVISVPAYFNDAQRRATLSAGELAGLKVERLINEPTAAAIAYGIHDKYSESNIIVVDLGGGTFDVSVLELFDGVMEVHASAGDNYLGGEDFTQVLIERCLKKNKIDLASLSLKEKAVLYRKFEEIKHLLSQTDRVSFDLKLEDKNLEISFRREEFEAWCIDILAKIRKPVERAISDARLRLDELDEIILVGGATRMPMIRSLIGRMFRRLPSSSIDADQVVVLGCAIQAALISKNSALNDVVLTDVCPYTLGVEISVQATQYRFESGHFLPIIERNSTIPTSKIQNLCTIQDYQESISCKVYQGESRLVINNILLGQFEVKLPKKKAGEEEIDIRFTYDVNGILEVQVTVMSTQTVTKKLIRNAECSLSDSELMESFRKLESIKIHPRENAENQFALSRAERLYEESLSEKRQYLSTIISEFERILDTQSPELISKALVKFEETLDNLEEDIFE